MNEILQGTTPTLEIAIDTNDFLVGSVTKLEFTVWHNSTMTIHGLETVGISATEQAKIIAGNIKAGVSILGVTGTYSGEGIELQTKSATYTPATTEQTASVTADQGYDGLSSVNVTVNAIPYNEELNSAGGYTVTIG